MSGQSKRASSHIPRQRKLSPEQEGAILALAATRSLRALAADFGVSHETVRAVLRGGAVASDSGAASGQRVHRRPGG